MYTPNKLPQSRAANTPRLLGWSNRRTPVAKQIMTHNKLSEMYENVLKKVARGTINKKNAWDVQMCSYVPELVRMEEGNFARSGTVINAASIVLAHQIDSVHDRGHTVWKNLISNAKGSKDPEALRDAARERRRMNKKTLCKNNDIYTNLDQLRSSRDPFFEKTAASFDAGDTNGLMVKNLTTQKSGSLVFNGDDKLHCLASTKPAYPEVQLLPEQIFQSIPFPTKRKLRRNRGLFPQAMTCNKTIEFYERQAEAIEQGIDDDSCFDKDMDLTQKLNFDESIIDQESSFMAGGESEHLSDFGNANELADAQQDNLIDLEEMMAADPEGEQFIWDGEAAPDEPHAFQAPNLDELTNFFSMDNMWSGNRKIKALRKRDQDPLQVAQQKSQRKRRKINFIEFVQRVNEGEDLEQQEVSPEEIEALDLQMKTHVMQQVDQRLFHTVEPRSLMLPQKVVNQWRTELRILPRDFKVGPDIFFRPSLRPNVRLHCPKRKVSQIGVSEEPENPLEDFQDPALESSAAPFEFPEDDDQELDLGGLAPIMDENLGELLNWNDPNKRTKLEIPYTREPCEFNVSLMKKRIWRRIVTKGVDTEDGEKSISYDDLFAAVIIELPKKTVRTITVHIFYVCLLYCCNEYKLRLKQPGIDDCENFEIFTTKESPLPSRASS